jgi:hypothetical protein
MPCCQGIRELDLERDQQPRRHLLELRHLFLVLEEQKQKKHFESHSID